MCDVHIGEVYLVQNLKRTSPHNSEQQYQEPETKTGKRDSELPCKYFSRCACLILVLRVHQPVPKD